MKIFIFTLVFILIATLAACSPAVYSYPTAAVSSATITPSQILSTPALPPTPHQTAPMPTSTTNNLTVYFIDVGQGDAILIDYGTTEVLIDGGKPSTGVVQYIEQSKLIDGDLEAIVATHPDLDHIGGLIDVLKSSIKVDTIYWSGETNTTKTYQEFKALADKSSLIQIKRGDTINADNLTFAILNPPGPIFNDTNNNSIVLKLDFGDTKFLFEGDAEKEAEANMLASGLDVSADILKVGHHGSSSSSSVSFIKAVSPQTAIYMAGVNNPYGHPHAETISTLQQAGAYIYGTDKCGTITVTSNGYEYWVTPQTPTFIPTQPFTSTPSSTSTPSPSPTPSDTVSSSTLIPNVKITKIFYDGIVKRIESDEYVEITNLGNEPADLAGWLLKDISEGYPSFTFPSYTLQAGKSLRVYTNEIHPEYGGFSFKSGKAIWNNTNPDTAALFNKQGQEVSRKSY